MSDARSGRPPHSLDPDASHAARLGAKIRSRRQERGLTLQALADLIGFSPQHLSEVELANAPMSESFVAACDHVLDADGALLALLPDVVWERAMERHDRSTARRREEGRVMPAGRPVALRLGADPSEAEEDVDPINRRSLLGAGIGAALGLGAAPAATREIDPDVVSHWMRLLRVLGRHDGMFGPHEVLGAARHELALISEHRQDARGELRTQLVCVESRWAWFASWLSHDAGDWHRRDSWTDRALALAHEAGDPDMVAWVLMWQSRWAAMRSDARRAITLADAARGTRGTTDKIRGLSALRAAHRHALADDKVSCQRSLDAAHGLLDQAGIDDQAAPWDDLGRQDLSSPPCVLADEARCWLSLRPHKAIAAFEDVLRLWPDDRPRGRGMQQARLALACAAAGEPERAAAEGVEALSIAQRTKSDTIVRDLRCLDHRLAACDVPAADDFRQAFAAL